MKEIAREIRGAIREGDLQKVVALIGDDKNRLNLMTTFGTWLHVAASFGKLDIVKHLVEMGADLNAYGGISGGAPLNCAASDGHRDVAVYLIDRGAKLDVSEPQRNPLFGAILGGHIDIARLLVDAGIDADVKYTGQSMKGMDAIEFAHERGQSEIKKLLLAQRQ